MLSGSLSDGRAEFLVDEIVVLDTPESEDITDRRAWFKKDEQAKLKSSVPLADLKPMFPDDPESPWEATI